jgi:hypothetical protein
MSRPLISGSGLRSPDMGRSLRIAVSGHRGLPSGRASLISEAIRVVLEEETAAITGLSCLADGADQIFARAVLNAGGAIEAVVPALKYREGLPAQALTEYDALLARAVRVHELPFSESTSEAHMAASEFMVGLADELWAVWDGQPARSYRGTADVVAYARDKGIPTVPA